MVTMKIPYGIGLEEKTIDPNYPPITSIIDRRKQFLLESIRAVASTAALKAYLQYVEKIKKTEFPAYLQKREFYLQQAEITKKKWLKNLTDKIESELLDVISRKYNNMASQMVYISSKR